MKKIKNILVSRLRFMGDIILTTPVMHNLKTMFPEATITYLAEEPYISLLHDHPAVHRLLPINKQNKMQQIILIAKLLFKKYDVAIDLFGNPRSALLTWLSGARIRIGGNFRGRKYLYNRRIEDDGRSKSAVQFHLNYLVPLNIPINPVDPYIILSSEEKEWAKKYLDYKGYDLYNKLIGIHPGASWPAKKWLPERFAELANKLAKQKNTQILFTMGPGEEKLLRSIIDLCKFDVIEPEIFTFRQLAAILHNLNVYISNDCGPMHLGPAVGTPTVGIFGPGEPEIWFPYSPSKGHRLVYHNIDCSRCHKNLCEKMDCMKAITVEDVYDVVMDTINSKDIFR